MLHIAARNWLGTPFAHQGRSRHGIDCAGLVAMAARDTPGLEWLGAFDVTGYAQNPHEGLLERLLDAAMGQPVSIKTMRPGDVVAMAFPRVLRHIGIVGDYDSESLSLIHTYNRLGACVIEHRMDAKWATRIKRVYRPEVRHVG